MGMNRAPDELELSSDIGQAAADLRERFRRCPEPTLVLASEGGVLPAELNAQVIEHLSRCPVCTLIKRDLAEIDGALLPDQAREAIWRRIRAGMAVEDEPFRETRVAGRWWQSIFQPWPVAAALAVILVGFSVLVTVNLMRRSPERPQDVALNGTPVPPIQPPSQPGSSQPLSPTAESAFRLQKAAVTLPATGVMVWRGHADDGNAQVSPQIKDLAGALAPYRTDNYAVAADRLEHVRRKYPRLAEAPFYLGVCQLFLNQNQEAVANLKMAQALARKQLAADAGWYLALGYHRSGLDNEARPILEKLCHSAGKDSARACAALGELTTPQ